MNLDKLITIAAGVVLAFSLTMNLDKIQNLIWRAQAKLIYEARTETWGSPRFFPDRRFANDSVLGGSAKPTHKAQSLSRIQNPKVPLNRQLQAVDLKAE